MGTRDILLELDAEIQGCNRLANSSRAPHTESGKTGGEAASVCSAWKLAKASRRLSAGAGPNKSKVLPAQQTIRRKAKHGAASARRARKHARGSQPRSGSAEPHKISGERIDILSRSRGSYPIENEAELHLTSSAGVAVFRLDLDAPSTREVLKSADTVLYLPKSSGRNNASFEARPSN